MEGPPPTHNLLIAWGSCVCCWPIALMAVLRGHASKECRDCGDIEGARIRGQAARWWGVVAIIVGSIFWVIVGIGLGVGLSILNSMAH